jgi:GNAT superfamily N-acetyltransferase
VWTPSLFAAGGQRGEPTAATFLPYSLRPMRDPLSSDAPTGDGPSRPFAGGSDQPAWKLHVAGRVHYRPMQPRDLPFVVGQHLYHFPDGFFARLGTTFLTEYYRAFLTGSAARTTIAEIDGAPVGYLVGVTDPAAHREHVVQRHGRALVLKAVAAMLRRPSLGYCFVRTRAGLYARKLLRRRRAHPPAPLTPTPSGGATAVLTHVAVTAGTQSHGIGSTLISRFEEQVAAVGCERLTLVTASGEDGAGPYYRRRGWEPLGERSTPDGLRLTTYERPVRTHGEPDHRTGSEDTA